MWFCTNKKLVQLIRLHICLSNSTRLTSHWQDWSQTVRMFCHCNVLFITANPQECATLWWNMSWKLISSFPLNVPFWILDLASCSLGCTAVPDLELGPRLGFLDWIMVEIAPLSPPFIDLKSQIGHAVFCHIVASPWTSAKKHKGHSFFDKMKAMLSFHLLKGWAWCCCALLKHAYHVTNNSSTRAQLSVIFVRLNQSFQLQCFTKAIVCVHHK